MSDVLTNKDGRPWINNEGKPVPAVCPECGNKVGLYCHAGEPVFHCSGCMKHYFGEMQFPEQEDKENE